VGFLWVLSIFLSPLVSVPKNIMTFKGTQTDFFLLNNAIAIKIHFFTDQTIAIPVDFSLSINRPPLSYRQNLQEKSVSQLQILWRMICPD